MRIFPARLAFHAVLLAASLGGPLTAAEEWEAILDQALKAEHSQTRQDGVRQVDASTVKGLKAIWSVLAIRDPNRVDWFVREGAYEALSEAKGAEAEKEMERVLKDTGPELEHAREAIVYSVIWRVRKAVVRAHGQNDDNEIAEAKYQLRKLRGVKYFEYVLPSIKELDPEKKYLRWIQGAFADKSPRVRRAAITGMTVYPDHSSIPLLIENLKKLEKQKPKNLREWVLTRGALETLTGQYFRNIAEDWARWWDIEKAKFTIEKRVEEEGSDPDAGAGRTVVVRKEGIEVQVNMKVAGTEGGYPLLVLPWRGYEVDYFRPYFHEIEEFCRVYYLRIPQISDFKGLPRDSKANLIEYPTKILARAMSDVAKETGTEKCAVLAHGDGASTLAMMFAAEAPQRVSHLILINPSSSGKASLTQKENVRRVGQSGGNKEIVKGIDNLLLEQDGKPRYQPSDDAEAGGMGRSLANLYYADPTEPETGALSYLYSLPGGVRVMNDDTWSVKQIFAGKKMDFRCLIIMGEKAPWSPMSDMNQVAGVLKHATVVKMPNSAETPFMSETYLFTKSIEDFMKPALLAMKKEKEKEEAKESKKGKTKVGK